MTRCRSRWAAVSRSIFLRNAKNSSALWRGRHSPMTLPVATSSAAKSVVIATQIVLFAPGSNRPNAEPGPDNAQLVATIKNTNASPEGPVLTVADKDGDRKITIGPDTVIWIARAARITDIKVGSAVTMTGVKREDGSLQVLRATIGPAGAGKPR